MKINKLVNKYGEWFLYWMVVGVGFVILFFLITSTWIGIDVNERCNVATARYDNIDCVPALLTLLEDDATSSREQNYAIWSLGQLGDERALETLESMYTGVIPDREPYDDGISQYELKKAIKLVEGGFNITALVWR